MNQVSLDSLESALHDHNLDHGQVTWEMTISVAESEALIKHVFQAAESRVVAGAIDIALRTDLALNWLLNTYDRYEHPLF